MDIIGICSKLKTISVSNELFFSCNDFFNLLKMNGDIGYIDCIITPFYISNNKTSRTWKFTIWGWKFVKLKYKPLTLWERIMDFLYKHTI